MINTTAIVEVLYNLNNSDIQELLRNW